MSKFARAAPPTAIPASVKVAAVPGAPGEWAVTLAKNQSAVLHVGATALGPGRADHRAVRRQTSASTTGPAIRGRCRHCNKLGVTNHILLITALGS